MSAALLDVEGPWLAVDVRETGRRQVELDRLARHAVARDGETERDGGACAASHEA
jgi:hypothetical protein